MRSISITVPTALSDIKLSQYQKFLRTTKGSEDAKFVNRQLVGIFCNISDAIVNNMTLKSFNEVVDNLSELFDIEKKDIPFIRIVKHEGKQIGFIPNLDEITVGEQADLTMYIEDWQKMDKAMGVLFRPVETMIKEKYIIQEYKENVSLDLTMDVVFGAYFFLINLLQDLLSCIPKFIKEGVTQDQRLLNLLKNGDGIKASMDSLEEIFFDLRMCLN